MELSTIDVEKLICSDNISNEFIYYFNNLCKTRNIQFETWIEILFLTIIREKKSSKIINISNNLDLMKDGEDVKTIFYNIVLSNLFKGIDEEFIYQILSDPGRRKYVINYAETQSISNIKKVFTKLIDKNIYKDYILYHDLLDTETFWNKLSSIFDSLSFNIKQDIILLAIEKLNFSLCSRINEYFKRNPIDFDIFSSNINNDSNPLIIAICNITDIYSVYYNLSCMKNFIINNRESFPLGIDNLLLNSIKRKNYSLLIELGEVLSKRKIIGLISEHGTSESMKFFLEKFQADPELEEFITFA